MDRECVIFIFIVRTIIHLPEWPDDSVPENAASGAV